MYDNAINVLDTAIISHPTVNDVHHLRFPVNLPTAIPNLAKSIVNITMIEFNTTFIISNMFTVIVTYVEY